MRSSRCGGNLDSRLRSYLSYRGLFLDSLIGSCYGLWSSSWNPVVLDSSEVKLPLFLLLVFKGLGLLLFLQLLRNFSDGRLHDGIRISGVCDPQVADEPVIRLVEVGGDEGAHVGNLGDGYPLDLGDDSLAVSSLLLVGQ